MLRLNLRKIAEEMDVAIGCFDEALKVLSGYSLEDSTVTDEDREKIRKLSRRCIRLEALREETGIMILERSIHKYNVQEAVEEISRVRDEFKDARSLINV